MAVSNSITAILNFITFLSSIPVIAAGIWFASEPENECVIILRWPVVVLGALLLLGSLIGFAGAYWNKPGLLAVYLFSMAVLILLLIVLLILGFTLTRTDGSYGVAGRRFEEYRLGGYSAWLRDHVTDSDSWRKIRTCLAVANFCPKLNKQFLTADQFFRADISPLQSGCCKPPTECGYSYVNPTEWINPTNPTNPTDDPDCYIWNNDPTRLCYNCNSCKAALLESLMHEWSKANVILIVALVVLILVYLLACTAYKNAQTHNIFVRYKHGWI